MTDSMTDNPWVRRPPTTPVEAQPEAPALPPVTGATRPAPPPVPRHLGATAAGPLGARAVQPAQLYVVGAHGGSGESRLASLIPNAYATGHAWPDLPAGISRPSVLVARGDITGLLAARSAAAQWARGLAGPSQLVGLVIMADVPGKMPRPLHDFLAVISGGVPRCWPFPFIDSWRLSESSEPDALPRQAQKVLRDLTVLMSEHSSR